MERCVVLVHGFMRQGWNMRYLSRELKRRGYVTFAPNLPTTFRDVRACGELLAEYLDAQRLPEDRVVHFAAHSMGGLVVRDYLSRHVVEGLGRVVLMGTPNKGSRHGNRALRVAPRLRRLFGSLPDLSEPGPEISPPLNLPAPEVGIIAGTRPDPVRKMLLRGDNDGLVTLESVRGVNVKVADEILMPCPHEWLHWRSDTVEAIVSFLETGKFKKG
ncbi:MAG: alpha/beta fold hydrolase [Synergistaceae bacterium]|nr:alpha/beta fold hydrolase [Synergistaceae bacterium]